MDDAVGYLLDGLTERNLDSHVHVVIVSRYTNKITYLC